jgi:hypothetical protein
MTPTYFPFGTTAEFIKIAQYPDSNKDNPFRDPSPAERI